MIPDDKLPYHPAPPDDTTKNKRAFLPILKPSGPDDGSHISAENEKFLPNFCKTLTGRLPLEDGSDFDDFWTKSIASAPIFPNFTTAHQRCLPFLCDV